MTASTFESLLRHGALAFALAGSAAASVAEPAAACWSPSWMASTQPVWNSDFVLPLGLPLQFDRQTVRQVARLSIGGTRLRVVISNEGGTAPLHIGAARMARHAEGSATVEGSDRPLRFGGETEVTVPPGARLASDPVDIALPALSEVAVSLYLPRPSGPAGFHFDARETAYVAERRPDRRNARMPAAASAMAYARVHQRPRRRNARAAGHRRRASAIRSPTATAPRRAPTRAGPMRWPSAWRAARRRRCSTPASPAAG
jgi:hypothetical protein